MEEKAVNYLKVIIFIFGLCISLIFFQETSLFGSGFLSGYYAYYHDVSEIETHEIDLITLNDSIAIVGFDNTSIIYDGIILDNSGFHQEVYANNITNLNLYNFNFNDSLIAVSTFYGNSHGAYRDFTSEQSMYNVSYLDYSVYAVEANPDSTPMVNNTHILGGYSLGFKLKIIDENYYLYDGYGTEHDLGSVSSENITIQHVTSNYQTTQDLQNTTIRIFEDKEKVIDFTFAYNTTIESAFPMYNSFIYKSIYGNNYSDFGIYGFSCEEFDGYESYYNLTTCDTIFTNGTMDYLDTFTWNFNVVSSECNISIYSMNNTEYAYFQINTTQFKAYNSSLVGTSLISLTITSYSDYDFTLVIFALAGVDYDSEADDFALSAFYPVILCCVVIYISVFPMLDKLKDKGIIG